MVSFYLSIWQVLKEPKIASPTTRRDRLREPKLTNLCLVSRNVLEHLMEPNPKDLKVNTCPSDNLS